MTSDPIADRVKTLTDELRGLVGSEGAVVVMIGLPDGTEHSKRFWQWRGRCLQVEGLLSRCAEEIRTDLRKQGTVKDEAIQYLIREFVRRFGCDAEDCTNEKLTMEALLVLTGDGSCRCGQHREGK